MATSEGQIADFRIGEPIRGGAAGARYRGEVITTGAPVIILTAPIAAAARLALAYRVVDHLSSLSTPPLACPRVLHYQVHSDGSATLVLGEFPGEPLAAHLARSPEGRLPERAGLAIAFQQASLLKALHAAGFSGLAPETDEVWWDEPAGRLTLLGWEEVTEGTEQATADLTATASLWHQLLLGTPPPMALWSWQARPKHPAWEALSLGTRRILSRALNPDRGRRYPTAEALWLDLSAHLARFDRPPAELLAEGRRLLERDAEEAAIALDLARRATPPPVGAENLFLQAWEQVAGRAERAFRDGQADLDLIQYTSAARAFERAALAWEEQPEARLRARRWQMVAEAGRLAAEALVPYKDHLPRLRQVVELADLGQFEAARQALEEVLAQLPEAFRPAPLLSLQAELRLQQLSRAAADVQRAGNDEEAARLYTQALAQRKDISYWDDLVIALGDPEEAWRACQDRAGRHRRALALIADGERFLGTEDYRTAEAAFREAVSLAADLPILLRPARQGSRLASLRGQVQEAASLAGNEEATLGALVALLGEFPEDGWGQAVRAKLRAQLLQRLTQEPAGKAGLLLRDHFTSDYAVQDELESAASLALLRWRQTLEDVRQQIAVRTPSVVERVAQALDGMGREISRGRALSESPSFRADTDELLNSVQVFARQVAEWREEQARLRDELEQAIEGGFPADGVLEAAQRLGLELYDEPERSVARLLQRLREERAGAKLRLYQRYLDLADEARLGGQVELARQSYQAVQMATEAPEEVRSYARLALDQLDSGETPAKQAAELARTWRQRIEEMERLLARLTTLDRQVEAAEAVVRPKRRWRQAVLRGLLVVGVLGWLGCNTLTSLLILSEVYNLRASLALSVSDTSIPVPTRTASVITGGRTSALTPTVGPTSELTPKATREVAPVTIAFVDAPLTMSPGARDEIEVRISDLQGRPIADGTEVMFEATEGRVDPPMVLTRDGMATTVFTAGLSFATARITARVGQEWRGWNITIQTGRQMWRVTGYVYKGDTQEGIRNVPVSLLGPGPVGPLSQELASGKTDDTGRFELAYEPAPPLPTPVQLQLVKQNVGVWNHSLKAEPAGNWVVVDSDTLEVTFNDPAEAEGDNIFRVQIRRVFSGAVKGEAAETLYAGALVALYRRVEPDQPWEPIGNPQRTADDGTFTLEDTSVLEEVWYQVRLMSAPAGLRASGKSPELPAGGLWQMSPEPPAGRLPSQVVETSRALGPGDGVEFGGMVFFIAAVSTPTAGLQRNVKTLAHLGRDCGGATGEDISVIIIFMLPPDLEVELTPEAGDINDRNCVPVKVRVWVREAVVDRSGTQPVLRNFQVGQEQVRLDPDKAPPPAGSDGLLTQSLHQGAKDYGVGYPAGVPQVENGFMFVEIWGWVATNALTP